MRIVAGKEAASLVESLATRGQQLAEFERKAVRIVEDVRHRGNRDRKSVV